MKKRTLWKRSAAALVLLALPALAASASAMGGPGAIADRAFELRLAGDVDQAIQLLEKGLADHPEAGVLHYELARARLFLLDIPAMHASAEAAVLHAPDNNDYRYFAAIASAYVLIDAAHHGDRGKMKVMGQKTFDQLEAILQSDPNHHQARYLFVQQCVEMAPEVGLKVGNTEDHIRLLEQKDPIMGAKARCCLVNKKEQRRIWEKIVADHPEDCRALVEAAEGLVMAGELDLAESCLDIAIAKDKQSCYGLLRVGLAYAMKEDWVRAIELTQKYLKTEPLPALRAFAVGRLGLIHKRMGDADRGRELMNEARELDPHFWPTVMPPPQEIFMPL